MDDIIEDCSMTNEDNSSLSKDSIMNEVASLVIESSSVK